MSRQRLAATFSFCSILAATAFAQNSIQIPGGGFGLRGQYFNNKELKGAPALVRTDATINFVLGQTGPGFGVLDNEYSVRWSGDLAAAATGAYTFTTVSDDGVRLWVNGQKLIDNWTLHGTKRDTSQPVTLEAGKRYDIVLEYYENLGGSTIQLLWKTPGQTVEDIIPTRYLYPADSIFLSALTWVSAVSGWGPAEKDMSNGEKAAGDGRTLQIGGRRFVKGLGVHAQSQVVYNLEGKYEYFATFAGVDDEVGNQGSAKFQIWLDGAMAWESPKLGGDDAPRAVVLNVAGKRELKLITTDNGDGINLDHTDWADAQLIPASSAPPPATSFVYLSDMTWMSAINGDGPVERDESNGKAAAGDGKPLTIRGVVFKKGLGTRALSDVKFKLGGKYTSFLTGAGIDDEATGIAVFEIWVDGVKMWDSGMTSSVDQAKYATLNVTGKDELRLVVRGMGGNARPGHGDWANARLTLAADVPPVGSLPAQVTGLQAAPGNAQAMLSWNTAAGAVSYNIYRGTSSAGESETPVATGVTGLTFTNTGLINGTKYFYKVAAVNATGVGPKSAEVNVTPVAPLQIPPQVSGLKATAGDKQVALAWTAAPTAVSYNIYRGTAAGAEDPNPVATGVTALAFTNTGLANGVAYFYKVAAANAAGVGPQSAEVTATPVAPLQAPPAVTGLTATPGDKQVSLSWATLPTAASYNVYRGTSAGGESGTPIATGVLTTAFTNTLLTNGTTYFYKVKAVNAAGTGPYSNEAFATPSAPPPVITPDFISAVRFLRSASWGPTASTIDRVRQIGIPAYIDEQVAAPPTILPDSLFTGIPAVEPTQEYFVRIALTAPDQLRQRVAFTLHKILVVSAVKTEDAGAIVTYTRIFQNRAFGNFLDVLKDVTLNPAMGHFLDMVNNKKAAGGVAPNENYAREVMQLFSLGLTALNPDGTQQVDGLGQPVPTYSETDVTELARVFTGWTYNDNKAGAPIESITRTNFLLPMEPVAKYHDTGIKTLLNQTISAGGTAQEDLDKALGIIFNHPNVGPFISKQLIQQLVTSNPSLGYVSAVTAVFNNDGAGVRGNLQAVIKAILTHPEAQLGTPAAGKLKEPLLFMTSIVRPLNATIVDQPFISDSSDEMGQKLFYPGSVFSYFSPGFRISGILGPEFQIYTTVTATNRANFIARLITNGFGSDVTLDLTPYTSIAGDLAALTDKVNLDFLGGQMSPNLRSQIIAAGGVTTSVNERMRTALYLALVSNEFQVDH